MNKPIYKRLIFFCLILIFGTLLVVASGITLRRICLQSRVLGFPSAYGYTENNVGYIANEPTLIYKTNTLSDAVITLPTGYMVKLVSESNGVAQVEYNSITGFIKVDEKVTKQNLIPDPYQTANIVNKSDAGTYLRTEPNTTSEKISIIPANSNLSFIGSIIGTTPSDGTSDLWFYCIYEESPTKVHLGYVYSERINVLSGLTDRTITETSVNPSQTTSTIDELTETPETNIAPTKIDGGLKLFLIILFSVLGVVVFSLLLITPKKDKNKAKAKLLNTTLAETEISDEPLHTKNPNLFNLTKEPQDTKQSTPPKTQADSIPAYKKPEFGSMIDFSQPIERNNTLKSNKPTRFFSEKKDGTTNSSIISKYFDIE